MTYYSDGHMRRVWVRRIRRTLKVDSMYLITLLLLLETLYAVHRGY